MNKYLVILVLILIPNFALSQIEDEAIEEEVESFHISLRDYNKKMASVKRPQKSVQAHFKDAYQAYNGDRNVRVGKGLILHPPLPIVYKEGDKSGLKLENDILTPAEFEFINYFEGQRWVAKKDGKFGALTFGGEVAIPFLYDGLIYFKEGSIDDYKVRHHNRKEKKKVLELVIARYLAKDPNTQKLGIIDAYNRLVLPFVYDEIKLNYGQGYLTVAKDGKKGILDFKMKTIVPITYDDVKPSSIKFWAVTNNGKTGLYKDGKIVAPLEYKYITPYMLACQKDQEIPDFYIASKGDNIGLLDKNQTIILTFEYQNIMPFVSVKGHAIPKSECVYYFSAIKDQEWKVFNKKGKEILNTGKLDVRNFIPLSNGKVIFLNFVLKEGFLIDLDGKTRTFNNYQLISTGYKFKDLKKKLEEQHQGKKVLVLLFDKSNNKYTHYILDDGSILEME